MDSKTLNQSPPFIRFYSLRFRSGDRLTTMEARNFDGDHKLEEILMRLNNILIVDMYHHQKHVGEFLIYFNDHDDIDNILLRPTISESMFTSWMEANKQYPEGRSLTYAKYVSKFVYVKKTRTWKPRKSVSPFIGELYYLKMTVIKGPTCYEDIRTVSNFQYPTFRDACFAIGLLKDDK
ncbi:hypothetical protein Lal_00032771 [Lupinus albus]|nr:hypothetical protein Lal_00032771 [Lupinus albus]